MINVNAEIEYRTARSGGKGGQNVNKVETMVEARWSVINSKLVSEEQKQLILERLKNKISTSGELIVKSSESRSQLENKEKAAGKLNQLIAKALISRKKRVPTKVPKPIIEKRLEYKRLRSQKKENRRKDWE